MHLCRELRVRKAKAKDMMISGAPLVSNKLCRLPAMDLKPRETSAMLSLARPKGQGEVAMGFEASYIFEKMVSSTFDVYQKHEGDGYMLWLGFVKRHS
jgi:hypothetical protein